MTQPPPDDLTTKILIQIRDEMREMRASFEARFDGIERRLDKLDDRMAKLEDRMDRLEARMDRLEARMDELEARMDRLEARMDRLEARFDALEAHNSKQHGELLAFINEVHSDLKKFASIANETILHYADEMDKVRGRLNVIEDRLGIPHGPE